MTRGLQKEGKKEAVLLRGMDIIMCGEKMKKVMKIKAHFHKVIVAVKKEIRLVEWLFCFVFPSGVLFLFIPCNITSDSKLHHWIKSLLFLFLSWVCLDGFVCFGLAFCRCCCCWYGLFCWGLVRFDMLMFFFYVFFMKVSQS